jgi:hypothetical protein
MLSSHPMGFLIQLLVFVIVAGLIYWLLTLLPIPEPFKNIVMVIFIVICIVWLIGTLTGGFPMLYAPHSGPLLR